MKLIRRRLIAALTVVFSLSALQVPQIAFGQQRGPGNGFRVSPPRYEITAEPGKSETVSIFVENLANSQVTAKAIVNDFVASDNEDGQPRLIIDSNEKAPTNSFKDIVAPIPDTAMKPLERKEIKVTVQVPKNGSPGGYYGVIRFTPSGGTGSNDASNVALTASVGTLFLVKVPGNINEKLQLASFQATKSDKPGTFFSSGPITIVTRLKNTGNIHVQPFGKVVVKNMWGKVITSTEINNTEPRGNILPNSTRKFETAVNAKRLFGRYTATGNFSYGTSGDLISAKTTFYVIPYQLIIIALLVLFFLIFVFPRLLKRYKKRIIAQAQKQHNKD